MNKEVAIIGIGAMGSLFGARLTPVANVTLLGRWPEHRQAIAENGLHLTELDGSTTTHRLTVFDVPAAAPQADVAIILVKSYQTERAALWAADVLKPDGFAITLQNGLGNYEKLSAVLGANRVLLGTTSLGAATAGPGHIRHAGDGPVHIAASATMAKEVALVDSLFTSAGFTTRLTENVDSLIWGKLAVNAGINPLTALLNVPNGFLVDNAWWRSLMINAAREVADVARALQIELPYENAGAEVLAVATATADNISSMLQDVRRGAPTEIDAICGHVVRASLGVYVPTPTNRYFLEMLQLIESGHDLAIWQERIKHTFNAPPLNRRRPPTGA